MPLEIYGKASIGMKKRRIWFLLLLFLPSVYITLSASEFKHDYLIKQPLTDTRLKFMPVPSDYRNYFILQSIDDTTNVIIGDFVGTEKLISMVMDLNSDGKPDRVFEYFPDIKKFTTPAKPTTSFYKDFTDIKRQIIEGTIFKNTYSYKMNSIDLLKLRLEKGRDIFKTEYGYTVKIYDPDKPTTIQSEFFFAKQHGRYDLIFTTYYYKIFNTKIAPVVFFSVYCKSSKDPMIAEIVEALLKMAPK